MFKKIKDRGSKNKSSKFGIVYEMDLILIIRNVFSCYITRSPKKIAEQSKK